MPARLRSDLQIQALRRTVEARGLTAMVLHRGHDEGGMIFVKWVAGRQTLLFTERTVGEERRWVRLTPEPMPESDANLRIGSERDFDPDLWALEIMGPFESADEVLRPVSED